MDEIPELPAGSSAPRTFRRAAANDACRPAQRGRGLGAQDRARPSLL